MRKMSLGMVLGVAAALMSSATMVAESCTAPYVGNGGKVLYLNVAGIKCDEGSRLVAETIKASYGKYPAGYTCKISVSGRNTTYDCNGAGGKHYDFRYAVN
jgi:hypothetical protein